MDARYSTFSAFSGAGLSLSVSAFGGTSMEEASSNITVILEASYMPSGPGFARTVTTPLPLGP